MMIQCMVEERSRHLYKTLRLQYEGSPSMVNAVLMCLITLRPRWFCMMQTQRKHMMFQPVAERVTRRQQTNVTASALQTVIYKPVSQPLLSASSEPPCKWCPLRPSPILTTELVPPPLTPWSVPVKGLSCLFQTSIMFLIIGGLRRHQYFPLNPSVCKNLQQISKHLCGLFGRTLSLIINS